MAVRAPRLPGDEAISPFLPNFYFWNLAPMFRGEFDPATIGILSCGRLNHLTKILRTTRYNRAVAGGFLTLTSFGSIFFNPYVEV